MLAAGKIAKTGILTAVFLALFTIMSCGLPEEPVTAMQGPAGREDPGLYLFDYKDISINTTTSVGTRVKNCNIYLDRYGDLIVLGELENTSNTAKTDIEITMDFMGGDDAIVHDVIIPVKADYLRKGARYPFIYVLTEKEKYIELSSVRIGVNYRDHNYSFKGNPIVQTEEYFYRKDRLTIKGSIINMGEEKIADLLLLCTFYDNRDRVVFVKECHIARESMMPKEKQDFTLEVLLDDYLKGFTRFRFEVFFSDEIRVNV